MKVTFLQGGAERAGGERVLLALLRRLPEVGVTPDVVFIADGPFLDEVREAGISARLLGRSARLRSRSFSGSMSSGWWRSGCARMSAGWRRWRH